MEKKKLLHEDKHIFALFSEKLKEGYLKYNPI